MNKKIIVALLTFIIVITSSVPALAISKDKLTYAQNAATELKKLGLFVGTEKGFELERPATRVEAVVMLLRLLGKENDAKNYQYNCSFKDVPAWAYKYISYAYYNSLTSGLSSDKFGSLDKVTDKQYLTFVLRALRYSEYSRDFTWDNPYELATKIGLIEQNEYKNNNEFLRADLAIISYKALSLNPKWDPQSLEYYVTGNTALWKNTAGQGNYGGIGVFNTPDDKLVAIKRLDINVLKEFSSERRYAIYDANLGKLNGMIGKTYGMWYMPGLTQGNQRSGTAYFRYDDKTNRYGLQIESWRHSYNSDFAEINAFNAILETFYFLCGDKEVAYALWSWFDAKNLHGRSNTDYFGFKDTTNDGKVFSAIMKGIEIDVIPEGGKTTVYFR